jgi:hypothetical protein
MSSDITREINKHFMKGNFVNQDAYPQWFDYLESEENVDSTNLLFSGFGVKIIRTGNGRTWYPVWQRMNEHTRSEIEKTATAHKREYRHVISFFRLVLGAISHGHVPQGGAILRESTMTDIINNNSNLADRLKATCSQVLPANHRGGDQIGAMVKSLIRWACSERIGLLEEINTVHSEYRFTGKVDWINDMNEAFNECINVPVEVETIENLSLF